LTSGLLRHVIWLKVIAFSEVLTASIIRATGIERLEAVSTSETSVKFHQTAWRNSPDDSRLHTCLPEK
jgi:hypothetical protein